jgi:GNAT superfamily N-acetyltransferase
MSDAHPGRIVLKSLVLRGHRAGDIDWIIERHGALYSTEYGWDAEFEALVAEIGAAFLRDYDPDFERCWIAELDGVRVGSVMCVRTDETTAKLRLLLIEPSARGHGIGSALVEACIAFARDRGYQALTLWTNDVLVEARSIYERRGFTLESSEPHQSFGHDLVGQYWRLWLKEA